MITCRLHKRKKYRPPPVPPPPTLQLLLKLLPRAQEVDASVAAAAAHGHQHQPRTRARRSCSIWRIPRPSTTCHLRKCVKGGGGGVLGHDSSHDPGLICLSEEYEQLDRELSRKRIVRQSRRGRFHYQHYLYRPFSPGFRYSKGTFAQLMKERASVRHLIPHIMQTCKEQG